MGASPDSGRKYSGRRPEEIWDSFSRVLDVCEEEGTDLLFIAGDLFHRQPLLRELKEVDYLFSKLTHTKVVLIAGNHDYIKWNSYYRTFQWHSNVYPLFEDKLQSVEFPKLETCVYGFSYYKKEITEARYQKASPWKRQKYEILLAHGGDEKHIPVKKEELLSLGYDYIAMGHIHKPGVMAENKIIYPGALEPIDKNDTGIHGYIRGEIRNHQVVTQFVPFAKREYVHLEIKVDKMMLNLQIKEKMQEKIQNRGMQHMYKVILRGFRNPELEISTEHMDCFGNILEIVDETKPAYHFEKLKERNEDNLLGNYIRSLEGCEPGSVEYLALYEGVEALLETKRR